MNTKNHQKKIKVGHWLSRFSWKKCLEITKDPGEKGWGLDPKHPAISCPTSLNPPTNRDLNCSFTPVLQNHLGACSKMMQPTAPVHKDILLGNKNHQHGFRFPLLSKIHLHMFSNMVSVFHFLKQHIPQTQLHLQACQKKKKRDFLWVFAKDMRQGLNWGDPFFPPQKNHQ